MARRRILLLIVALLPMLACTAQTGKVNLSETEKRRYDHYFLDAMIERQKGNNDAAFDLLRHCLEINPNAAEAYYFLAQYYSALKDADTAVAYFKRAAELNPDNKTYMETLAHVYIRKQDYAEAIKVVEKLYDRNKGREDLLEMLFQLYQQENDYKHAIGILERLEQIDGKSERLSVAKSEIYTKVGDRKAAIAEMAALAKQYPNDLNYLAMYGEALMMNDQPRRALDIYDRILKEEPDNSRVLMSLRTYHQALGHDDIADSLTQRILLNKNTTEEEKTYLIRQEIAANEAAGGDSTRVLNLFRQILTSSQQDVTDMAILCATYMELKKMPNDSISPILHQALNATPDNAAVRLQLVGYALQKEDLDGVIDLCQAGRQYNPEELAFYFYQGLAYQQKDSVDEALSSIQEGIGVISDESNSSIVSDFYLVLGDLLHKKGEAEKAFLAYDSCLQWKADNMPCLNNYAYYLSEQGEQLERAEKMSLMTIKAEAKNATYLDTYAWILFMQKRYQEAKVYIDQAMQNLEKVDAKGDSISNATVYDHAGDIYWFCDEPASAVLFWEDALKDDAGNLLIGRKVKLKKYIKE